MAASLLIWYWGVCILGFMLTFYSYFNISMPKKLREFLMYGKVRSKGQPSTLEQYLDVPKRWFKHFYLCSMICNGYILYVVYCAYFMDVSPSQWFSKTLVYITDYPLMQNPKVSHVSVFIAMCMIVFQGTRRFLECQFISKTSSKMNVIHYLLGMTFYPCLGPSVLAEGPPLSQAAPFSSVKEMGYYIEYRHILGIVLFLWASYHQYTAGVIFAALRKSASDTSHKIPHGDWFEYVSNPHYLAEIIIYFAIGTVLGYHHIMWWLVMMFVVSNQVAAGAAYHKWYLEKFEDYPSNRKAIIPWIY